MHTPSTRILSALAYDRGEEYDPGQPPVTPRQADPARRGRSHSTRAHASCCPAWRPLPPATHRLRPKPDLRQCDPRPATLL